MNKKGEYIFAVLIGVFFEGLVSALFLSRQNYLADGVWALPIIAVLAVFSLFALNDYYLYYNKEKKGGKN